MREAVLSGALYRLNFCPWLLQNKGIRPLSGTARSPARVARDSCSHKLGAWLVCGVACCSEGLDCPWRLLAGICMLIVSRQRAVVTHLQVLTCAADCVSATNSCLGLCI